jgi:hypothetical protein
MKKTLVTLTLLAGAACGYSQGTINWGDYVANTFAITVFGVDPAHPTQIEQFGNSNNGNDIPAGSATAILGGTGANNYGGAPLSGSYTIGLYLDTSPSAVQNDVFNGSPASILVNTWEAAPFAGQWTGNQLNLNTSFAAGSTVYVELAAWATGTGLTSYAQAAGQFLAAGYDAPSSALILGGSPPGQPPITTPTLAGIGLTDFSLATQVPEPSTIALGVIGASAFLMRLRRNK